jgi:hypothetical protein
MAAQQLLLLAIFVKHKEINSRYEELKRAH